MRKRITREDDVTVENGLTISRPKNRGKRSPILVGGEPAPACKANVKTYGNIWTRELNLKKGESKAGHKHNFDHLHFLAQGSVEIRVYDKTEKTKILFKGQYDAPSWIKVPKEHFHDIIGLADESVGYCIQAIHNEKEEVVATDYANDDDWMEQVNEFERAHGMEDETLKD